MHAHAEYRYSQTIGFYAQNGRGFNNPVDVALGRDGTLYVLNRAGSDIELRMPYKRVTMCTVEEDYLGEFASGGTGEGQLMWPVAIASDAEGHIYISDEALHRISIFDARGRFLTSWGNHRVQVLGPDGAFRAKFRGEAGLSRWAQDYFIANPDELAERQKANLEPALDVSLTGDPREESAHIEKLFWGPTSVKVDGQGRIYIVDSCRHRIQIYRKATG